MRDPQGYFISQDLESDRKRERDTFTCAHCNKINPVPPMADPASTGWLCHLCGGLCCARPRCMNGCDPFERKLERAEAAQDARRWLLEAM